MDVRRCGSAYSSGRAEKGTEPGLHRSGWMSHDHVCFVIKTVDVARPKKAFERRRTNRRRRDNYLVSSVVRVTCCRAELRVDEAA